MENGRIHAYIGDGKGKTTAAVGLSVRAYGAGERVLFCQFLKSGLSSEISALKKVGIDIYESLPICKFTNDMSSEEFEICKRAQRAAVDAIFSRAGDYGVIVLDEVLDVLELNMISAEELINKIKNKGDAEVIMTGRKLPPEIFDICDYVSDIGEKKHPYKEEGLLARKGIEF